MEMNLISTFHKFKYNVTDITRALHKILAPEQDYDLAMEFWHFRQNANQYLNKNAHLGQKIGKYRLFNGWEAIDLALILVLRTIPHLRLLPPAFSYDRPGLSAFMLDLIPDLGNIDTGNWELQISSLPGGLDISPRQVGQTTRSLNFGQVSINLWWLHDFMGNLKEESRSGSQ